ncbi:MAG: thiamine phosphate synthase [Bacteroidales bacterium]|nr:thiamine phosphate synthase [Bacteroidales bacterium]MCM1146638.1 thiamine phosphate synthase [Bacteroidales bacterium]MCM1206030.1 thiamine phosphate synthase [Bacillota bacterium]MCM1511069.1 thiamine phosphate synthase [Clostridium sp.]
MFRTIVITRPTFHDGEAMEIASLLKERCDLVHVRKPGARHEEMERLIRSVPAACRCRLVLHGHFRLAAEYSLYGIHLNSRHPHLLRGWQGSVSRSCHSLAEIARYKAACDYLSLSPVFDSVSKQGYRSAFSQEDIRQAVADGIIDDKVYALGGITFARLPLIEALGFGGGMILGDAWR